MALSITHSFTNPKADGADATVVRPSDWNAAHTLTGIASAAQGGTGIAFFAVAGPTVERIYTFPDAAATIARTDAAQTFTGVQTFSTPIATGSVATMTATVGGGVPTPPNNTTTFLRGDGTFAAASGGATLDGITAATASQAGIANGDFNIRWDWAKTTNSTVAFELGETTAATGGTSTAGVPNQVIAKFSTLAASTASPLTVYARGAHVFSIPPAGGQILAANGLVGSPLYSFAGSPTTGAYASAADTYAVSIAGTRRLNISATNFDIATTKVSVPAGSASASAIENRTTGTEGIYFPSGGIGLSIAGVDSLTWTAGVGQHSKGTADAVSYALNFRKARGTVASPTVITTGDDLATISGFGYVGATGTYVEAARITYDSIGTIANTTSGVGGVIRFSTAIVGSVGVTERMTVWNDGDVTIGSASPATTATVGFPQIPTMAGTPTGVPTVKTGFTPIVYDTTGDKIWLYDYGAAAWKGVAVA